MSNAEAGDTVRIHYTGRLDDGATFDSSVGHDPLEFILGAGHVITGFDEAVTGMAVGEEKSVRLEVDAAYGPRDEDLVHVVARDQIPAEIELEVGTGLQTSDPDGNTTRLVVRELRDADVVLDANHPLAGEALTFDLHLVEIVGS